MALIWGARRRPLRHYLILIVVVLGLIALIAGAEHIWGLPDWAVFENGSRSRRVPLGKGTPV